MGDSLIGAHDGLGAYNKILGVNITGKYLYKNKTLFLRNDVDYLLVISDAVVSDEQQ